MQRPAARGIDELVAAFYESLSNPLSEKGRTKAIVGLLQSDYPLVKRSLEYSAADIADWLTRSARSSGRTGRPVPIANAPEKFYCRGAGLSEGRKRPVRL